VSRTSIGWTAVQDRRGIWHDGFTFNPWHGCAKVSTGCQHCYAERIDQRFRGGKHWGLRAPRRHQGDGYWRDPLAWNAQAVKLGVRLRVFCGSVCDWLEDRQELAPVRERLLELLDATPALDWLLLSKRPENLLRLTPWTASVPKNVWLGASVENQEMAETRLRHLVNGPARLAEVLFVSAEPLLGPLELRHWTVDWVIVGSESGPGARIPNPEWLDALVAESRVAGYPVFLKQWQTPGQAGRVEQLPHWRGRQYLEQPRAAGWQPLAERIVHTCHARGCTVEVPPRLLMCARHWRLVPRPLQAAVWRHYRAGQENTKDPSRDYLQAAVAAIDAVAAREAAARDGQLSLELEDAP
jgi:protein gp37